MRSRRDAVSLSSTSARSRPWTTRSSSTPSGRPVRAIVVHEAVRTLGIGAEIAARVQEECFYELDAPVLRVAGYDLPYPPSRVEDGYLPDLDRVLDAVDRSLRW